MARLATATLPRLDAPPIREAVVEYRFSHATDPDTKDLYVKEGDFRREFPEEEQLFEGTVNFQLSAKGLMASAPEGAVRGFRFRSADRSRAVAFTQSSMAFSRFLNYQTREQFLNEADYALAAYLQLLPDAGTGTVVTRLGVRYINQIELDVDENATVSLEDYFGGLPTPITDDPVVRVGIDQQMRSDLRDENSRVRLHGPVPNEHEGAFAAFVVDIDVWRDVRVSVGRRDAIMTVLSSLLDLRSRLFFGSVKPKALERYGYR